MNDRQRQAARKAKKPSGYRCGGPVRGYQDGGMIDRWGQKSTYVPGAAQEQEPMMRMEKKMEFKPMREAVNAEKPKAGTRNPPIINDKSNRFVRG